MSPDQFASLKVGDTVRHRCSAEAMTVKEIFPDGRVTVVRFTVASNPAEWLLIGDAGYPLPEPDGAAPAHPSPQT